MTDADILASIDRERVRLGMSIAIPVRLVRVTRAAKVGERR